MRRDFFTASISLGSVCGLDWIKYLMRGGVMTRDKIARAADDGPRYKAIGNSWAVSNVAWLGCRIDAAMRATSRMSARL